MKLSYCLLITLCMGGLSCGLSDVKPDAEMMKSMEEVVKRYQGKLSYSYGVNASTSTGKSKYIELTLEESPLLNSSDDEFKAVAAGGIAYTFYKPLEKNVKFTDLNIMIKEEAKEYEYSFEVKSLKRFDSLLKKFKAVMDLYDSAKFEQLANSIYLGKADTMQKKFVSFLNNKLEENGPVTTTSPYFGFVVKKKDEGSMLIVCYRVFREKHSHWVQLFMNLSDKQLRVIGMQHLK